MKQIKSLAIAFWNVLKQVPSYLREELNEWLEELAARLDTDLGDGEYGKEES